MGQDGYTKILFLDTTGIGELLTLNVTLNVPGEDFYQ